MEETAPINTSKFDRIFFLSAILASILLVLPSETLAQSTQASIGIKIDVAEARVFFDELGLDFQTQIDAIFPQFKLVSNDLSQIYIAVEMEQELRMRSRPNGVRFVAQAKFRDPVKAQNNYNKLTETLDQRIVDGKKYLIVASLSSEYLLRKTSTNSIEYGSTELMTQPADKRCSTELQEFFNQGAKSTASLYLDRHANAEFVEETYSRWGGTDALPPVVALYRLLSVSRSMTLDFDLTADSVLAWEFRASQLDHLDRSQTLAAKLVQSINSFCAPPIKRIEFRVPDIGKRLADLASQVKVKSGVGKVSIEVAQPTGGEELVRAIGSHYRYEAELGIRRARLRTLALGILNYEAKNQKLPFHATSEFHEDLAWTAKIIPFVSRSIAAKFDPKASANKNRKALGTAPPIFGQGDFATVQWIESSVKRIADLSDGASNTLMLIEVPKGAPWLEKNSLKVEEAIHLINGLNDGEELVGVFYDGVTCTLNNKIADATLRALLLPNDGHRPNRSNLNIR